MARVVSSTRLAGRSTRSTTTRSTRTTGAGCRTMAGKTARTTARTMARTTARTMARTTARTMAGKTVVPRASSRNGTSASADLSVEVNGLKFMNPFVCGSGPPGTNYAVMKKAFEEGT